MLPDNNKHKLLSYSSIIQHYSNVNKALEGAMHMKCEESFLYGVLKYFSIRRSSKKLQDSYSDLFEFFKHHKKGSLFGGCFLKYKKYLIFTEATLNSPPLF